MERRSRREKGEERERKLNCEESLILVHAWAHHPAAAGICVDAHAQCCTEDRTGVCGSY